VNNGRHKQYNNGYQIEVVTFRPDAEIREALKKLCKDGEMPRNKSPFYNRVFYRGLKALKLI
jgi:hypothetical protein